MLPIIRSFFTFGRRLVPPEVAPSGQPLRTPQGPTRIVRGIAFRAPIQNGASSVRTLPQRVWNPETNEEHANLVSTARDRFQTVRASQHLNDQPISTLFPRLGDPMNLGFPPLRSPVDAYREHAVAAWESAASKPLKDNSAVGTIAQDTLREQREKRRLVSWTLSQLPPERRSQELREKYDPKQDVPPHQKEEISPILSQNPSLDFDHLKATHERQRNSRLAMTKRIQDVIDKNPNPKDRINALEELLIKEEANMQEEHLQHIFHAFRELGAHDQIVEMMDNSQHVLFKETPITLEHYAKALMKSSYFNPDNVEAIADILLEFDREIYPNHAVAHEIMGHIFALKKNAARNYLQMIDEGKNIPQIVDEYKRVFPAEKSLDRTHAIDNYQKSLSLSTACYEKAFREKPDPRYGARLIQRYIELGNIEEAKRVAAKTQVFCRRDYILESTHVAVVRAFVEACYVNEAYPHLLTHMEDKLLALCTTDTKCRQSLTSLRALAKVMPQSAPGRLRLEVLCLELERHQAELQVDANSAIAQKKQQALESAPELTEQTKQLNAATIIFSDIHSTHGGNWGKGGQTPRMYLNHFDVGFFGSALAYDFHSAWPDRFPHLHPYRCLMEIQDPADFLDALNAFVRSAFNSGSLDMENLTSDKHKHFDDAVQGMLAIAGAGSSEARQAVTDAKFIPGSRTNPAVWFMLGLGDCRHYAQVKQVMWELWRSNRISVLQDELEKAQFESDTNAVEKIQEALNKLLNLELRILECYLFAPVALKQEGKYSVPAYNKEGHLISNDTGQSDKVESHVTQLCIHREGAEKTDGVGANVFYIEARDSFYNHVYLLETSTISTDQSFSKQGSSRFVMGTVELADPKTDQLKEHPLYAKPAPYAGEPPKYVFDLLNNAKYFGLRVQNFTPADMNPDAAEKYLGSVVDWYLSTPPK